MLTCEEIQAKAAVFGMPIDRLNYHHVAEQIHPVTTLDGMSLSTALHLAPRLEATPEAMEHHRARFVQSDNWTDMVVWVVTLWQYRERVNKELAYERVKEAA